MKPQEWDRWHSTPASNILQHDKDAWKQWVRESLALTVLSQPLKGSSPREPRTVALLKQRLGPQDYTWQGSCRNWIWESKEPERWRVFASKRGLSFEVNPSFDVVAAKSAWGDFLQTIGVSGGDIHDAVSSLGRSR